MVYLYSAPPVTADKDKNYKTNYTRATEKQASVTSVASR